MFQMPKRKRSQTSANYITPSELLDTLDDESPFDDSGDDATWQRGKEVSSDDDEPDTTSEEIKKKTSKVSSFLKKLYITASHLQISICKMLIIKLKQNL